MTSRSSIAPLFVRFASVVLMGPIPFAGSTGGLAAVDVEDMAGDEGSLVRRDEDDRVGQLLGEAERTHRNRHLGASLGKGDGGGATDGGQSAGDQDNGSAHGPVLPGIAVD